MVLDGIQGAIGVKIIKPVEVPKVLAIDEPCFVPRICRIWYFTLTFGALQLLTVLEEAEDLGAHSQARMLSIGWDKLVSATPRPSLWLRRIDYFAQAKRVALHGTEQRCAEQWQCWPNSG